MTPSAATITTPGDAKSSGKPGGPKKPPVSAAAAVPPSDVGKFRELIDELVFVFVIVMFMKMFLVELYKIPTGSMTPELLGGPVAQIDVNHDGLEDILYWELDKYGRMAGHTFLNNGTRKILRPDMRPTDDETVALQGQGKITEVFDRILVNKLIYWFRPPKRGDVVVFKVPDPPFRPEAPIYIKRLVGEPGDRISFIPDPAKGGLFAQLAINGNAVDKPDFFKIWRYLPSILAGIPGQVDLPYVDYVDTGDGTRLLKSINVPKDQVFVFGDNTEGSLDSRYWGGVPLENLKGRAFMKVWPLHRFGMIH